MSPMNPSEEGRTKSFLKATTFRKPGDLMRDLDELKKSGVGVDRAKLIVITSFLGSSALAGLLGYLILWHTNLAKGQLGPIPYIVIVLAFWYWSHYLLAKVTLLFFKR